MFASNSRKERFSTRDGHHHSSFVTAAPRIIT
jgi:hypothetical protein